MLQYFWGELCVTITTKSWLVSLKPFVKEQPCNLSWRSTKRSGIIDHVRLFHCSQTENESSWEKNETLNLVSSQHTKTATTWVGHWPWGPGGFEPWLWPACVDFRRAFLMSSSILLVSFISSCWVFSSSSFCRSLRAFRAYHTKRGNSWTLNKLSNVLPEQTPVLT